MELLSRRRKDRQRRKRLTSILTRRELLRRKKGQPLGRRNHGKEDIFLIVTQERNENVFSKL
jgi:hypothetical protein